MIVSEGNDAVTWCDGIARRRLGHRGGDVTASGEELLPTVTVETMYGESERREDDCSRRKG